MFQHALNTDGGDALIYGKFTTVDPVKMPELKGEYLYIEKIREQYNMHTRTVTHSNGNGGTYTTIEIYYTWDYDGSEEVKAKTLKFMGSEFPTDRFSVGGSYEVELNKDTVSKKYKKMLVGGWSGNYLYEDCKGWDNVGDHRWYFHAIDTEFSGTILADLKDHDMFNINGKDQKIDVLLQQTINDVLESRIQSEKTASIVFWIFWGLLTGGAIFAFYYIDNPWLEDEARERRKYRF
jgi:hypothetical protein